MNLCILGNRALYSANLNFNEYTFEIYNAEAFRKYIYYWGLRQTSDRKAAPTNDAHLEYILIVRSIEHSYQGGGGEGHIPMTFRSEVSGSNPALTTTWICFSVAPSSNPRPRLQIANWFASGQLGFLTVLCSHCAVEMLGDISC